MLDTGQTYQTSFQSIKNCRSCHLYELFDTDKPVIKPTHQPPAITPIYPLSQENKNK